MAGVAGPLCVRDRWGGLRFILGLLAGESVASFIVAVIVLALGWLLRLQFGTFGAWEVVAVIVTVLGVADVIGRTPQFRRQVPQHFIHRFSAGRLGIIWGFDLATRYHQKKHITHVDRSSRRRTAPGSVGVRHCGDECVS